MAADLSVVADRFGLGEITETQVITAGTMNLNWRVTTTGGVWAVKRVLDVDAAAARRQHRVTIALAERGLPVPPACTVTSAGGDTLLDLRGRLYAVTGWVAGVHRGGTMLSPAETEDLGSLLSRLQVELGRILPAVPETVREMPAEAAAAKDGIDRYAAAAAARPEPDEFDAFVIDRMTARRVLLAQVAHLRPDEDAPVGPCGWIHGDFQHLNVLYGPAGVSAVLDWDRLKPRPVAAELVRSATLLFGRPDGSLDLQRVTAFAAGYRSVRPLPDAAIVDAVGRLWWERICDTWQLRRHYERQDPSCDHLFRSAEASLAWWTSNREPVSEAFTARRQTADRHRRTPGSSSVICPGHGPTVARW
ncbi:homoserine kinase type II [Actinoplanes teichomyceticus]|uniref:Homoserine kinase type II n=1 Tax=Actinoplanes teichomyceticus TaxID=1867 RepID=A0A561WBY5_ACTTI|nr:homoserine kinase type II [Actinoplanes teichomyceticus]